MKHNKLGAILLVAGTCIGSGVIALPMVLAKIGLIPSILLMVLIWFVMYYTSLVNIELNLQAGRGMSLGELGKRFSGPIAKIIGVSSLKLLTYSLLAVFIYAGASIIQKLLASRLGAHYSFEMISFWYTLGVTLILLLPIKWIDYCNRLLFVALLLVVSILIMGLAVSIKWSNLPLFSETSLELASWSALLPVVFTSFGFQVIFHTLTNYCHKNAKMLKSAFFWGSLIPTIIYIIWTCVILSVVYHDNPQFYKQMAAGEVEVGGLVEVLSGIAKSSSTQLLVWWISLLAIVTSVLGIGVGLIDSLNEMLAKSISNDNVRKLASALLAIIPAYLAVIFIPNAFIAVLGFAGMILTVIAILLPVYLFYRLKKPHLHFDELKSSFLIGLSLFVALVVIVSEIYHMW